MAVDYKQKYLDLRSKFAKACDRYYRTGYEEGMKEGAQQAQMQAMQDQMAMQQQQQMAEQGIDPETGQPIEGAPEEMGGEEMGAEQMGGQPMPEGGMPMQSPEEMGGQQGSELDQHIGELESLVSKGEKPKVTELRKAVHALADLRKSQKAKLKSNHKEVVTSKQKQVVDSILKKWEKEVEKDSVVSNLEDMISSEGIKIE